MSSNFTLNKIELQNNIILHMDTNKQVTTKWHIVTVAL